MYNQAFSKNLAENYERYFVTSIGRPLAEVFMDKVDVKEGDKVLDVACGTGIIARMAAKEVGDKGTVTATDVNHAMVATARKVAPSESEIEWREAPAENLPLDDGKFDKVICQLSLQFFEDKKKALGEMHRVMANNGRLALNVPGQIGPLFETFAEVLEEQVSPEAAGFVRQVFSMNDPHALKTMINDAGFQQVKTEAQTLSLKLPKPKEFLWQYIHSTPMSEIVSNLDDTRLARFEQTVTEKWQKYVDGEGMKYSQQIIFAEAQKEG